MILGVFPSYKDKDMVDALYRYERDTRLSINILVENFLEELLYNEGYLTVEIEDTESKNNVELAVNRIDNFSTEKQHNNVRLYYNGLDFSSHSPESIEEIKSKLLEYSDSELEELSANNWNEDKIMYKQFLYNKLGIAFDDDSKIDKKYISYNKGRKAWRVNKNGAYYGSYATFEEAKKVRDFLILKKWNPKYSSKNLKLGGSSYREYIRSEMNKEQFV